MYISNFKKNIPIKQFQTLRKSPPYPTSIKKYLKDSENFKDLPTDHSKILLQFK